MGVVRDALFATFPWLTGFNLIGQDGRIYFPENRVEEGIKKKRAKCANMVFFKEDFQKLPHGTFIYTSLARTKSQGRLGTVVFILGGGLVPNKKSVTTTYSIRADQVRGPLNFSIASIIVAGL